MSLENENCSVCEYIRSIRLQVDAICREMAERPEDSEFNPSQWRSDMTITDLASNLVGLLEPGISIVLAKQILHEASLMLTDDHLDEGPASHLCDQAAATLDHVRYPFKVTSGRRYGCDAHRLKIEATQ